MGIETFTVRKENGKLFFRDLGGYETRNPSTIWCIEKADEIYKWDDFNEIFIYTGDAEYNKNQFTYSKRLSYNKLIPDFNFHGWPQVGINDYEEFIKLIDIAGNEKYEINKVGWIGSINTNHKRRQLYNIGNNNSDIFDIIDMYWINSGKVKLNATRYMSTIDLVKNYSILIDIEGIGYSGRLKHLLWSHRPVLLVDREHKEYFFEHLIEWVHYIPVKGDFSDLIEKTQWCINNYNEACIIAENAYEFSKIYLTREACYKQWNKIINEHILANSNRLNL
jgi:hypothetical protein